MRRNLSFGDDRNVLFASLLCDTGDVSPPFHLQQTQVATTTMFSFFCLCINFPTVVIWSSTFQLKLSFTPCTTSLFFFHSILILIKCSSCNRTSKHFETKNFPSSIQKRKKIWNYKTEIFLTFNCCWSWKRFTPDFFTHSPQERKKSFQEIPAESGFLTHKSLSYGENHEKSFLKMYFAGRRNKRRRKTEAKMSGKLFSKKKKAKHRKTHLFHCWKFSAFTSYTTSTYYGKFVFSYFHNARESSSGV